MKANWPHFALAMALLPGLAHADIEPKAAEPATQAAQLAVAKKLNLKDRTDFDDANYGFVGTLPDGEIKNGDQVVWSMKPYEFIKGNAPDTVNPSLWRQAELNEIHGLFKITDRVYQIRGLDAANMTIIEGDKSLIVIDSLFAKETSKAAMELYYQHRPKKPIGTLIYSHAHVDHFGGAKGIVSDEDVAAGKVQVIAPAGFMESAVAENVIAGNAMSRRGSFQFGGMLPPGPRGHVDNGASKSIPRGNITLLPPTMTIDKNLEHKTIDGIEIVFQLVPGSEAPSEMLMYFPQFHMLNASEDVVHSLHNMYAIRGADVRDGSLWSRYISEALENFGKDTQILIAQHQWAVRGNDRVVAMLKKHRDMYKFINDQSLRMINEGYTPNEIAETLRMPESLAQDFSTHGYYGSLKVNAKAVYQKYMGWYDANPANLDPLPPTEAGRKAVEYMGGADAAIARAREDFKKGEYRWVATVMSQVVFADPTNRAARELEADAFEQMGYQAESSIWRNAYLVGASELRNEAPKRPAFNSLTPDTLRGVSTDLWFDFLGVGLNGPKAEGKHLVFNWNFTDEKKTYALNLENSALTYVRGKQAPNADATLTLTRATLNDITLKKTTFADAIKDGTIKLEGDGAKFMELMSMMDTFTPSFAVIEPKKP